jgi:AraC family transcriptional regulator
MAENVNVYRIPTRTLFTLSFDGFRAMVAHSKCAGEEVFEQHQAAHRIFVTLKGQTRSTVAEVDQQPIVRRPDRPGVMTIVPAGVRRRVLLEDVDFLVLDMSVSDDFLRLCAESDADGRPAQPLDLPILQNVRNHWLHRAAHVFSEAGTSGASSMHLQTLAFAMVRHLSRTRQRVSETGGLDPAALARVLQLMQDRLADDLTLSELAAEAGLGISAFGRAFTKSVGMPPYRYFAALRMQRATELLAGTQQPLAAIAGQTGYADQAHFTTAFTRHTGIAPGKWRAEFGTVPRFLPILRKTAPQATA